MSCLYDSIWTIKLNTNQCLVVRNKIIHFNESKHWHGASYGARKTCYDFDDNWHYQDIVKNIINEAHFKHPITSMHGGWHLTLFYKNYTQNEFKIKTFTS